MLDTIKEYDNKCADLAEQVQNALLKDVFAREFVIRYNKKTGVYFSTDDLNADEIVMWNSDFRRDFNYFTQLKHIKSHLKNKPFFGV